MFSMYDRLMMVDNERLFEKADVRCCFTLLFVAQEQKHQTLFSETPTSLEQKGALL